MFLVKKLLLAEREGKRSSLWHGPESFKIQWVVQLNYCLQLIDINLSRRMLVTACSHNDICQGRKCWGSKKNISTEWRHLHYSIIRNEAELKVDEGEGHTRDDTLKRSHMQCCEQWGSCTLLFLSPQRRESSDILFNVSTNNTLQGIWVAPAVPLLLKALALSQSGRMLPTQWHNFEDWGCPKISTEPGSHFQSVDFLPVTAFPISANDKWLAGE